MDLSGLFATGPWIVAPVKGLVFPGSCCGCGAETDRVREFSGPAKASVGGVLRQFGGVTSSLAVTIPFCADCEAALRRRRRIWTVLGVTIGGVFGATLAATMRPGQLVGAESWHEVVRALTFVVVTALGAIGGWYRGGRRLPVRLRDYSEKNGTVKLWFRRPEYGRAFEELLEARSHETLSERARPRKGPTRRKRRRR